MEIITPDSAIDFALSDLIFSPTNNTFYTISGVGLDSIELTTTFYDGSYGAVITVGRSGLAGLVYIHKYT